MSNESLCPEEGHYPYKSGCSNIFYNCKRDSNGNLQPYVYKCPQNYLYWSVSRRCERALRLPMCALFALEDSIENWDKKWKIPVEGINLSARNLKFIDH